MKLLTLTAFAIFLLTGCTSNVNKNVSEDTTSMDTNTALISPVPLCFQRLDGTANQDTTTLRLVMEGNKVSGDFNHIPSEKDSRKGSISGVRNGDIIKAVWNFMQEGITDTLSVEFKLEGNRLLQKNYSINTQTGRPYLSDASRFNMEFSKIDCKK
ncbi:MAG TPA: hypothetical protein VNI52_10120 [Sphingobacteriaceae bacterium]|nr:hypothetical protein [Sphingobacteriaceae bacterium]